jgi:hypothetical protein
MSASETLQRYRKSKGDVKTGILAGFIDNSRGYLLTVYAASGVKIA